jgi:hypothetical protein
MGAWIMFILPKIWTVGTAMNLQVQQKVGNLDQLSDYELPKRLCFMELVDNASLNKPLLFNHQKPMK